MVETAQMCTVRLRYYCIMVPSIIILNQFYLIFFCKQLSGPNFSQCIVCTRGNAEIDQNVDFFLIFLLFFKY